MTIPFYIGLLTSCEVDFPKSKGMDHMCLENHAVHIYISMYVWITAERSESHTRMAFGSSAGAAGVSVTLFGAQQTDSQQGCWIAQCATKNLTFGLNFPRVQCIVHISKAFWTLMIDASCWIECPTVCNVPLTFRLFLELCWSTLFHWEAAFGIPFLDWMSPCAQSSLYISNVSWTVITVLIYAVPWGSGSLALTFPGLLWLCPWGALTLPGLLWLGRSACSITTSRCD